MTAQQLEIMMQQLGYTEPDLLPSPTPGSYNAPHQAMDFNGIPMNSATNEAMFPGDLGYFPPDFPPDFNNQGFPDSVYNPPTREGMSPAYSPNYYDYQNPFTNPPPNENMYAQDQGYLSPGNPTYGDYFGQNSFDVPFGGANSTMAPSIFPMEGNYLPGEYERFMYGDTGTADTSTGTAPGIQYPDEGNQPINAPAGPAATPYPFYVNQFPGTSANGLLGTGGGGFGQSPSTQDIVTRGSEGMRDANGNIIPGTAMSQSDEARNRNMMNFSGVPGINPRYSPSDALHPGQTMVKLMSDGTRVLVDATGKIISGAIQAGQDLYHNIMNDPRNTDPGYLRSIGYEPGQGTGSLFPGEVTGPSRGPLDTLLGGVEGQGGSFFHGELTQPNAIDPSTGMPRTDVGPSTMNPGGYNYPIHGPTPLAGAFANLGASGPVNLSSLGGDALSRNLMAMLRRNSYWKNGQLWSRSLAPTRTFEGGSLPVPFAFNQRPMSPAGPGGQPIQITNPAALGLGAPAAGEAVSRPLQQFGGRTGSGTPPVKPA